MSAEVDSMFSGNGIRPWHGLGTVLEGVPNSDEAIVAAGLTWEVEQRAAVAVSTEGELSPAPGCFLCRSDSGLVLGYVSQAYQVYQNKQLFQFADAIIENTKGVEAKYETAGALFGGKKIFLLLQLPDTQLVGDKVNNYLFLTNSHEGKESLVAGITNVRVVCNNTLQMALRSSKRMWRLRHTSSLEQRQREAEEALGFAVTYNSEMEKEAEALAIAKISQAQEEKFFRELFDKQVMTEEHKEELILSIKDIYDTKDDLQNFRGTKWGLYNAVADYVSNKPRREVGEWPGHRRMNNFMFGEKLLTTAEELVRAA